MNDSLLIAVHAFVSRVSMSVSVDETQLPREVNLSICFRELPFSVDLSRVWLKHIYFVLCALTLRSVMILYSNTKVKSYDTVLNLLLWHVLLKNSQEPIVESPFWWFITAMNDDCSVISESQLNGRYFHNFFLTKSHSYQNSYHVWTWCINEEQ